jgi:hypothetical protein
MVTLSIFSLPLSLDAPPPGYDWEGCSISTLSTTTAFGIRLDSRDVFLGVQRCVICGEADHHIQPCHIIKFSELMTVSLRLLNVSLQEVNTQQWRDLKHRNWIPSQVKAQPSHEPRNGLLMCANHRALFDAYDFFIRYFHDVGSVCIYLGTDSQNQQTQKFVFINFSNLPILQPFHGKAIALDIKHRYAPFPSLFIIHEMQVRGFHPFQPPTAALPNELL